MQIWPCRAGYIYVWRFLFASDNIHFQLDVWSVRRFWCQTQIYIVLVLLPLQLDVTYISMCTNKRFNFFFIFFSQLLKCRLSFPIYLFANAIRILLIYCIMHIAIWGGLEKKAFFVVFFYWGLQTPPHGGELRYIDFDVCKSFKIYKSFEIYKSLKIFFSTKTLWMAAGTTKDSHTALLPLMSGGDMIKWQII